MTNIYDDDESPLTKSEEYRERFITFLEQDPGKAYGLKIKAAYSKMHGTSLEQEKLKVLVELTRSEEASHKRLVGVDLVVLIDVSKSMNDDNKLEHTKSATKLLVKQLKQIDRLSVVVFSGQAKILCPLCSMTSEAKSEVESLVDELVACGATNFTAGLREAVQLLEKEEFSPERVAAIMLLSDGDPNPYYADGSQIPVNDIPIFVFGLGQDYHAKVLQNIAERSKGGTFSIVDVETTDNNNLNMAVSQCLAMLQMVTIPDLKLTIISNYQNSIIEKVVAGNYPQVWCDIDRSLTISFGDFYGCERRSILVDLVLFEVKKSQLVYLLELQCSSTLRNQNNRTGELTTILAIRHNEIPTARESPDVLMEVARIHTAEKIKEAQELAENEKLDEAKFLLIEARAYLERDELDKTHSKIKGLQYEVDQCLESMESQDSYEKKGRRFALASELAHALQRYAVRGDICS